MNYVTLGISFLTDFIITGGSTIAGAMVGAGSTQIPGKAAVILGIIMGLVAAARRVQALIAPSPTAPVLKALAILLMPLALLGGCTTISANPLQDLPKGKLGGVVIQGLQDATFNLDSAVTVGALDASDPAPVCFHKILTKLGADPGAPAPPGASFTPKVSDLISFGSVLYIRAKQLRKVQGAGIPVATECKVLVTDFLLDAADAGVKGLPGGGLLPTLR